jgi:hypothetical protein
MDAPKNEATAQRGVEPSSPDIEEQANPPELKKDRQAPIALPPRHLVGGIITPQ